MIKDYFSFEGKKKVQGIMSASHPALPRRLEEMLKVAGKLLLRRTKRQKECLLWGKGCSTSPVIISLVWPTGQLTGMHVPIDTHRSEPAPASPLTQWGVTGHGRKEAETQCVYICAKQRRCRRGDYIWAELQVTVTVHDWIKICRKQSILVL